MPDTYEVLVDELTVLKTIGVLTDPITGREIGVQQGAGRIAYKGEKIPASEVSSLWVEALDDEDNPLHESLSRKLSKSGDEPYEDQERRLGVPFSGYDDMDEKDLLDAMRVLPSSTVALIKQYESQRDDPRERVAQYNVGFAESPRDRIDGLVSSDLDEDGAGDEEKQTAVLTTRNVEEDDVQLGEGITGTGDPEIPYGAGKAEEGDEEQQSSDINQASARRTRRPRRPSGSSKQDESPAAASKKPAQTSDPGDSGK
jgi:hypothetical protein